MTAELAVYGPEDVETAVIVHLTPLRRTGFERKAGDPLPFTLVNHVTGSESVDEGYADPIVSVSTLCDKAAGVLAARDECDKTHRRILLLNDEPQIQIDGRTVAAEYVEVVEPPTWQYYSDNILRKIGRYRIGLPFVPASQ